ncbi:Glucose/arabinose dehydrogenase, beta-propeller fold [Zobellia uliginosa]|uniref:Glucose/arabinose dehydrogenase, beta-propeller fold n=1 Tax=Zobellia uliginosa TaxID=143224 RepID=A0ABY1KSL5_9FLAO|nr:hypothetical protein [Zobellia uliginosa]SIS54654.1 Glucose/arabinose dehydrogenase, beta-propeller fold [Zobellia uliginosa]
MKTKLLNRIISIFTLVLNICYTSNAQDEKDSGKNLPKEEDYYEIQTIQIPESIELGVGGMTFTPNGKLAVSTRRGEVWMISNPYQLGGTPPNFKLFAHGLHEPLGLAYKNGFFYVSQRPELTRLKDVDGDGMADEYKTVYPFDIMGNYHEYAYGPRFDAEGNMIVTLNLAWGSGRMESLSKWHGWMLKITEGGEMKPFATGMRSPAAFGLNAEGDAFYAENQGGWIGSGYITVVEEGDFISHPAGLRWSDEVKSPVKLKPSDIPDSGKPQFEIAKGTPGMKAPSVWIPHAFMGVSTSDIVLDTTGEIGPFKNQLFVGDQGQSLINRVYLEKIRGVYQGAVFPFRSGFSSGVFRLAWGSEGDLFIGMTSRGWGSVGNEKFGLQKLSWNGKMPFEIKAIRAKSDGFELEFTQPVDEITARNPESYVLRTFTYKYHSIYGSPMINEAVPDLKAIDVSEDKMHVRLVFDQIREGYIHEIEAKGIKSLLDKYPLLHKTAYYTLNRIPSGDFLILSEKNKLLTKATVTKTMEEGKKKNIAKGQANKTLPKTVSFEEVQALLRKHACVACHKTDEKAVGPSFIDISSRKYSTERIMELIYKPEPENWPEYATPMPRMRNVPTDSAEKIAQWINTLKK